MIIAVPGFLSLMHEQLSQKTIQFFRAFYSACCQMHADCCFGVTDADPWQSLNTNLILWLLYNAIFMVAPLTWIQSISTAFNKIFSGRQVRQAVKVLQHFRDRSFPETLKTFHTLRQLSAQEDFIEFCHCESFKT